MAAAARPPYPFDHRAAVRHLRRSDPRWADLILRVGRFRLPLERHPHPADSLLSAIVYQQLHATAAAAILGRLKDQIGKASFPSARQLLAASDDQLRATGLSRQKMLAVRDLAARALAGEIPSWESLECLDDASIVERLTAVRGVGPWTVHMLLIFRLGRPDVLPVADYGVQQGYQLAFGKRRLPTPRELAAAGEPWRPYRSVASWYLWQAVRLARAAKSSPGAGRGPHPRPQPGRASNR